MGLLFLICVFQVSAKNGLVDFVESSAQAVFELQLEVCVQQKNYNDGPLCCVKHVFRTRAPKKLYPVLCRNFALEYVEVDHWHHRYDREMHNYGADRQYTMDEGFEEAVC